MNEHALDLDDLSRSWVQWHPSGERLHVVCSCGAHMHGSTVDSVMGSFLFHVAAVPIAAPHLRLVT